MRRGLLPLLVLALAAPAAGAAEATVTAATEAGGSLALDATYAEPAQRLSATLRDDGATVVVRQGAAQVLRLAVRMPGAARLAPGTYDTAAGAEIALEPGCPGAAGALGGTFALAHAIPQRGATTAGELYLTATLRCGAETQATTIRVRLARAGARGESTARRSAVLPVVDGLATGWSEARGFFYRAVFAPPAAPRRTFAATRQTFLSQGLDGDRAIVQHTRVARSDLELRRLSDGRRLPLPRRVNSTAWEWGGALSGDWLLYQRGETDARRKSIRLVNLRTGSARTVLSANGRSTLLEPGDVAGDHAAFHRCKPRCRVFRYRISTRSLTPLATPSGQSDYAPAVLPDGTLYFVRSAAGCGRSVYVMRLDPGATRPVRVRRVASGHDVQKLDATAYGGARIVVYERYRCTTPFGRRDLRRIVQAPAAPAP